MTESFNKELLSLQHIDWSNKESRRALEAELRDKGLVVATDKDGNIKEIMPLNEWTPEHVFTLKWNSASGIAPDGHYYQDPFPPDWSLVPNAPGRLDLNNIELLHGVKYAIEGETGIMAVVTEEGIKITHAGVYQDISDRDVSPAGKVWGSGPVGGMSPLWIEIDGWDDFMGAELNAKIEGVTLGDSSEEARRIESFPAEIEKLARNWREDLENVLTEHEVYKDLNLKPGTRILFTSGLLYWAQEYGTRFFQTEITPLIEIASTLTFLNGVEIESIMTAHTVEKTEAVESEDQTHAVGLWNIQKGDQPSLNRFQTVDSETQNEYLKARSGQMDMSKLGRLVSLEGFTVDGNLSTGDMREVLPSFEELKNRYENLLSRWEDGAGLDLLLVRNGDTQAQRAGKLGGVIETEEGVIDDTIAKRSAQRAYDIATQLWDTAAPDLVISSGRSSSLATIQIALGSIGEPYPFNSIQRDWRLNERSFGKGINKDVNEFDFELLHSFKDSLENGENFSYVHMKVLSFMIDLLETANEFYISMGRPLKAVVSTHEGPMQIMQAILNEVSSKDDVFTPIESTESTPYVLNKPFEWPQYVTEEEICEGICDGECDIAFEVCRDLLQSQNTVDSAAAVLILEELRKESFSVHQLEVINDALEDFKDQGEYKQARFLAMMEELVKSIGKETFTQAALRVISIVDGDERFHVRSKENLSLTHELQLMISIVACI